MHLPETQQTMALFLKSERPLLCLGENASLDEEVTSFSLARMLQKMGKQPTIASASPISQAAKKLLGSQSPFPIIKSLADMRRTWIDVAIEHTDIKEVWYEKIPGALRIHMIPKQGTWKPEDIRFTKTGSTYDLLVSVGVTHPKELHRLFHMHEDCLQSLPLVNIDYHIDNIHFGSTNLVALTATSCAEVATSLLTSLEKEPITQEMATLLLCGMMSATKGFQHPRTNPTSLHLASLLMKAGADQQAIADLLYRTKSISFLRTWGSALSHLVHEPEIQLAHTTFTEKDTQELTDTTEGVLRPFIEDLLTSSVDISVFVSFYPTGTGTAVCISTKLPIRADEVGAHLNAPGGTTWMHAKTTKPYSKETIRILLEPVRLYLQRLHRLP